MHCVCHRVCRHVYYGCRDIFVRLRCETLVKSCVGLSLGLETAWREDTGPEQRTEIDTYMHRVKGADLS